MADDQSEVPPFELPEWGTEGAPPAPHMGDDAVGLPEEALEAGPSGETGVVLSTLPLEGAGPAASVLGLVTSEGVGNVERDGLVVATTTARDAALERLSEIARGLGAGTVAGVRLATVSRRKQVVVIAYGTALGPRG